MSAQRNGLLILVSAPSGAGKTSLVAAALQSDPRLTVSISHTTRPQRPGETDGENYHFVSKDQFDQLSSDGAFLEHAVVFTNCYGTSRAEVDNKRAAGLDVILEIDWQGAEQIRSMVSDVLSIFILPPSLTALEQRLKARGQDSAAVISDRLSEARLEISKAPSYDYLIVNDQFDDAL